MIVEAVLDAASQIKDGLSYMRGLPIWGIQVPDALDHLTLVDPEGWERGLDPNAGKSFKNLSSSLMLQITFTSLTIFSGSNLWYQT